MGREGRKERERERNGIVKTGQGKVEEGGREKER